MFFLRAMQTCRRLHFVLALAVLRIGTAGQLGHRSLKHGLRVQAATSKHIDYSFRILDTQWTHPGKAEAKEKTDAKAQSAKASVWTPPAAAKFKMPHYRHADSLSAATDGFLDWFVVCYWGTIIAFVVGVEVFMARNPDIYFLSTPRKHESKEGTQETQQSGGNGRMHKSMSLLAGDSVDTADMLGEAKEKELAPNIFSLSLVSSRGLAKSKNGNILSPKLVFVAAVLMGLIQLFTLFLVVYDIDPAANPYTETPGAPWKTSPFTVNCMKVLMVFFLGMYVVSEAADAYDNFILGVALKGKELLVHWAFVVFIPLYHYLITLTVILAGVSVILSCQDVCNILYNSMAILFITRVDELFWGFFERTFDIEADWKAEINESDVTEVQVIKKCIIMFPMLWGFCLLGRAWYRDQMPALGVRVLAGSSYS